MSPDEFTLIERSAAPGPGAPYPARHLIGSAWTEGDSGQSIARVSPATGAVVTEGPAGGAAEASAAVAAARAAFDDGAWSRLPGKERSDLLLKVADRIEADLERLALFETVESGKPISQAKAEIAGAADLWRHAAALARTLQGESRNALGADMLGLVLKEPVGVAALITPWNFPFLIVSQKLPYALAAGCTAVIKPSELTSASTVMLGAILLDVGVPPGVVNIVLGYGDPLGVALVADPRVDMVSFTGSTAVGSAIAAQTGRALKKVSLELGGKNAQVVFADADLDQAADAIVFGAYFNAGECCNAGSRLIVHRDVASPLLERVAALSRAVPVGDPLDPRTKVGALISDAHRAKIDGYVQAAAATGAEVLVGGGPLPIAGLPDLFYAPTVVDAVRPEADIAQAEVFGPVLAVSRFERFEEAVAIANGTEYGLSAGVWSADVDTVLDFVRRAHAGTVWANTWMDGYPELPFGGVKRSGLGRELGSFGLEEFLEAKTVQLRIGKTRAPWLG